MGKSPLLLLKMNTYSGSLHVYHQHFISARKYSRREWNMKIELAWPHVDRQTDRHIHWLSSCLALTQRLDHVADVVTTRTNRNDIDRYILATPAKILLALPMQFVRQARILSAASISQQLLLAPISLPAIWHNYRRPGGLFVRVLVCKWLRQRQSALNLFLTAVYVPIFIWFSYRYFMTE